MGQMKEFPPEADAPVAQKDRMAKMHSEVKGNIGDASTLPPKSGGIAQHDKKDIGEVRK